MTIEEKKKTLNPNIYKYKKKKNLPSEKNISNQNFETISHNKLANIYQNSHLSIETVSPSQRGISEMIAEHI